jgi:glycerate kinase
MRVLIIPDKFKGTLTGAQAAEAMARGWRQARPDDDLALLPMSDGGDGFGEIISRLLGAEAQMIKTVDAAHRPCEAAWWWHEPSRTAILEAAQAIGLSRLPAGKYHPFELDTEGLGALLEAAMARGARRCLVGIGGSATNDAGFGLARALGWSFFNPQGERLTRWTQLHGLAQIRPPGRPLAFEELVVAVDVQNLLLGPTGCTRVYGPQKGLRPEDFEFAERCLGQLVGIFERELHLKCGEIPGSGAAGGLGYGLASFAGARLEPGFGLFARYARLAEKVPGAHLVLTGEGAIDASTLMGKGVGELAAWCRQLQVPCIGLAGAVLAEQPNPPLFTKTCALTPDLVTREQAMAEAAVHLERLAAQVAREWPNQPSEAASPKPEPETRIEIHPAP